MFFITNHDISCLQSQNHYMYNLFFYMATNVEKVRTTENSQHRCTNGILFLTIQVVIPDEMTGFVDEGRTMNGV